MLKIKHYEFYEIGMRMSLEFISPGMAPDTRSYHHVLYISKQESLHSMIHLDGVKVWFLRRGKVF